jgi:hypothetical protein
MYAPDSIDLLKKSGIDFKRHEEDGINVETFGELMITSGMVLFKNVKWVSFHSYVVSFPASKHKLTLRFTEATISVT